MDQAPLSTPRKRAPRRVGRINKTAVQAIALPTSAKDRNYLWDDQLKGFGVMVTDKGTRSYIYAYKIGGRGGKGRRVTIGHHGSPWTAETARERARELAEMVRKKIDPFEALKQESGNKLEKDRVREELGFSKFADVFLDTWVDKRGMKAASNIHYVFSRDLKPWFKNKPLMEITSDEIQELFEEIGERSHSSANLAFAWLRKFFNFAVLKKRSHLPASPMHLMPMPFDQKERERYLHGPEIRWVWEAAGNATEPSYTRLIRLLILLGQRLREVSDADWSEIDLEAAVWIIPKTRTKNKKAHLVPLPREAVKIFREAAGDTVPKRGRILNTLGGAKMRNFGRYKRELDKKIAELVAEDLRKHGLAKAGDPPLTIPHWTHHDLRRTLGTGMQALRVPLVHSEAILNHTAGERKGITGVYHLYKYQREKTSALKKWEKKVLEIVADTSNCDASLVTIEQATRDAAKQLKEEEA